MESPGVPTSHVPSDWRPLIQQTLREVWPDLVNGEPWIEAQLRQESAGDPRALSPSGAKGLLQLMPQTAGEVGVLDPYNPEQNLRGGIEYLRRQYEHLPEIPTAYHRLLWSFAAYNGGRGYVNAALRLAREEAGTRDWWQWHLGRYWLMHRACKAQGMYPDHRQMWDYVDRILKHYDEVTK